jgi:hypothetical protein
MKTFIVRRYIYLLVFVISLSSGISLSYSQGYNVNSTYRIYQEAENLYRLGKYQASFDLIVAKAKPFLKENDSLLYLQIINLEKIFQSDNTLTVLLDETILNFLQRVQKGIFPDRFYSEVVNVYIKLKRFQNADDEFYTAVNHAIPPTDIRLLKVRNDSIQKYIIENKNSYYLEELNNLYQKNSNSILVLEKEIIDRQNDSISLHTLKKVGYIHTLAFSYNFPTNPIPKLIFDEVKDVGHFLNGTNDSISSLVPDLALGLSLVNFSFGLYTNKMFKLSLDWSLLDLKYHLFKIENSILKPKPYDLTYIEKLQSICVGTRIGLMVPVLVTKHIAVAPYGCIIPAICFLYNPMGYVVGSDNTEGYEIGSYEIKPKNETFNLSYEYGIRVYFFENKFVSAYIQNGNYNWANTITRNGLTENKINTRSNYKYQVFGVRIGF